MSLEATEESAQSVARCWAMTTGEVGMRNQAEGLAGMLDARFEAHIVKLSRILCIVPPHWLFSRRGWCLGSALWARLLLKHADFRPPWPEVLVTCGRRSVAFALALRMVSRRRTMTIHIQDPRVPLSAFDLVVLPEHDTHRRVRDCDRDHVLTMRGAMHPLTRDDQVAEGTPPWGDLPRPRIGVLLGGKSRAYDLGASDVDVIMQQLRASLHLAGGGSVLFVPSRRTGTEIQAEIRKRITGIPHYFWDGSDPNPYRRVLEEADFLCVTGDSVSMLSEACFTGKPVYILGVSGHSDRIAAFHESLLSHNHARWLQDFDPSWVPQRLDGVEEVVSEISARIERRKGRSVNGPRGTLLST